MALLFAAPALFVLWRTLRSIGSTDDLVDELAGPAGRTLTLALAVAATTLAVGTLLAWLLVRTDLAGRRFWNVVLVLPIVLPTVLPAPKPKPRTCRPEVPQIRSCPAGR